MTRPRAGVEEQPDGAGPRSARRSLPGRRSAVGRNVAGRSSSRTAGVRQCHQVAGDGVELPAIAHMDCCIEGGSASARYRGSDAWRREYIITNAQPAARRRAAALNGAAALPEGAAVSPDRTDQRRSISSAMNTARWIRPDHVQERRPPRGEGHPGGEGEGGEGRRRRRRPPNHVRRRPRQPQRRVGVAASSGRPAPGRPGVDARTHEQSPAATARRGGEGPCGRRRR